MKMKTLSSGNEGMSLIESLLAVSILSMASYFIGSTMIYQKKSMVRMDRVTTLASLVQDQVIEVKTKPLGELPISPDNCEVRHYHENMSLDTDGGFPKRMSSTSTACSIGAYSATGFYVFLRVNALSAAQNATINSHFSTPFLKLPSVTGQLWQLDFEGNYIRSTNQVGIISPIQLTVYRQ